MDARDRVQAALKDDPSGAKVNPQDTGAMLYSMLHGELGRVNSVELGNTLHLPGIENMTKDQLVKVMGGVNPEVVNGIIKRTETWAQGIDKAVKRTGASISATVNGMQGYNTDQKKQLLNGLEPLTRPAFRPSVAGKDFMVGNVKMNAPMAKQFYQAHPNFVPDPQTAKDLGL